MKRQAMSPFGAGHISNWIFVTGVPRSGTTFVGKVLSLPLEVDYIHEPFNPGCGMPGMVHRYQYVRPALDRTEMLQIHKQAQRLFRYDFKLVTATSPTDSRLRTWTKRLVGSRGPFYLRLAKMNPFHQAAVIKDPTAGLLTGYLSARFGVKPVIMIRHPVSLAASLQRLGWHPSLHWFPGQEALIEDYFPDERAFLSEARTDPVEGAAAHWRVVYKVLLAQAKRQPSWCVITHEALSRDPLPTFRGLYADLDLPWSDTVARKVSRWTQGKGTAEARVGRVQDFRRNSADIFKMRRDQLSARERRKIFEIVKDVALAYYTESSFDLG